MHHRQELGGLLLRAAGCVGWSSCAAVGSQLVKDACSCKP